MSKTMDNDAKQHKANEGSKTYCGDRDLVYAARDAQRLAADQAAEIERLKANFERIRIAYVYEKSEAGALRARVEELIKQLADKVWGTNMSLAKLADEAVKERDELRTQLDAAHYYIGSHDKLIEHKYTLLKRVGELTQELVDKEQQLQALEERLTAQDEGTAPLLERLERQKRDLDYRAAENAKLCGQLFDVRQDYIALEQANIELGNQLDDECEISTNLQTMLEAANARLAESERWSSYYKSKWDDLELALWGCEKENGRLEERLAELEDWNMTLQALQHGYGEAGPTIVKQTWQAVYPDGKHAAIYDEDDGDWVCTVIAVLRRDHMSDGTVRAVLEPIGETK